MFGGKPLNLEPRNLPWRNKKHRSIVWCKTCFDIVNRLCVDHECDRRTDGRTWRQNRC